MVRQNTSVRPTQGSAGDKLVLFGLVGLRGTTWNNGTPTKLFENRYHAAQNRTYDVSPDGQRFLMIKAPGSDQGATLPSVIVVQHWDEELKRLVPTK